MNYSKLLFFVWCCGLIIGCGEKKDVAPNTIDLFVGQQHEFTATVNGTLQKVKINFDSVIDQRTAIEDCTPGGATDNVYANFQVQIGSQTPETITIARPGCIRAGDLSASDLNFSKRCAGTVCLGLVNITEKSRLAPINVSDYASKLQLSILSIPCETVVPTFKFFLPNSPKVSVQNVDQSQKVVNLIIRNQQDYEKYVFIRSDTVRPPIDFSKKVLLAGRAKSGYQSGVSQTVKKLCDNTISFNVIAGGRNLPAPSEASYFALIDKTELTIKFNVVVIN